MSDYILDDDTPSPDDFSDTPLPPRFVLCYEHKSEGRDQYLARNGEMTWDIGEAKQFSAHDEAEAVAKDYPAIDEDHRAVEIMPIRPPTRSEWQVRLAAKQGA